MGKPTDLLQGTLDLLILKTLALELMHGWGIVLRIQQISGDVHQVQPGSLYPALHRLEHQGWIGATWDSTVAGRRAKYYALTRAGRKQLERETAEWRRLSGATPRCSTRCSDGHPRAPPPAARIARPAPARAVERELDEELRFHAEQMASHEARRGLAPAEAQAAARRDFGGLNQVKEACRDVRPSRPLEHVVKDVQFAIRLLVRGPVFTLVAISSLALGIGVNSAIFSLINAVVLRPLPVAAPAELFLAELSSRGETSQRFSYPLVAQLRDGLDGRAELAAHTFLRVDAVLRPASAPPQRESAARCAGSLPRGVVDGDGLWPRVARLALGGRQSPAPHAANRPYRRLKGSQRP